MARFHLLFLFIAIVSTFVSYRYYLRLSVINEHTEVIRTRLNLIGNNIDRFPNQRCLYFEKYEKQNIFLISTDGTYVCKQDTLSENVARIIQSIDFKIINFKTLLQNELFIGLKKLETANSILITVEPLSTIYKTLHGADISFITIIIPVFLILYLVVLFLAMKNSAPMQSVLQKVSDFEDRMSLDNKIKSYYNKDEWSKIEMALTEAENTLKTQIEEIKLEHKKTETLLESISDGILAVDYFHNALFYNNKFKNQFIKAEDTIVDSTKLWKIFDNKSVIDAFNDVLKTGKNINLKGIEFVIKNKKQYFDLAIAPLKNQRSEISGAVGVFHDVTESKLTEKMRVDFVANVSHEIRTPLTSIKGFAQMLEAKKDKLDDELILYLNKIISNSEKLISLFNDLLNLSVIESSNELIKTEIDLKEFVESITQNIRSVYRDQKIYLKQNFDSFTILADEKLIGQVFTNLIDNACKYNNSDPVITIDASVNGNFDEIHITDNGQGIPENHLDRIFERFYRVDSSRDSSSKKGTGIGLSIVKHIISKHQGEIKATSEVDNGTKFIIKLPRN